MTLTLRIARLVVLILTLSPPAFAQKNEVSGKDHFDRGMVFFNLQDYPSAVIELKAAYAADQKPDALFSLAQAQRLSGDCQSAIGSYRAFLRIAGGKTTVKATAAAEGLIHLCEVDLAKAKAEKAAEAAKSEKAAAETERQADVARRGDKAPAVLAPRDQGSAGARSEAAGPPPPQEHRAWYADGAGAALFVPGVLGVGAGAVFLVLGNKDVSSSKLATEAPTLASRDSLVASGVLKQTIGVIALSAGAALAVGAVIRYVVVGRTSDAPQLTVVPTPNGGVAVWSGAF
jgi:tetratricopeptide (TPR) repeat protein